MAQNNPILWHALSLRRACRCDGMRASTPFRRLRACHTRPTRPTQDLGVISKLSHPKFSDRHCSCAGPVPSQSQCRRWHTFPIVWARNHTIGIVCHCHFQGGSETNRSLDRRISSRTGTRAPEFNKSRPEGSSEDVGQVRESIQAGRVPR